MSISEMIAPGSIRVSPSLKMTTGGLISLIAREMDKVVLLAL